MFIGSKSTSVGAVFDQQFEMALKRWRVEHEGCEIIGMRAHELNNLSSQLDVSVSAAKNLVTKGPEKTVSEI